MYLGKTSIFLCYLKISFSVGVTLVFSLVPVIFITYTYVSL